MRIDRTALIRANAMTKIRDFLRAGFARSNGRHGDNYIVVRHSPDWLSFDPEASRTFCANAKLPEALIVDFVSVCDAAVAVGYRQFRSKIKEIAQQTLVSVEHAQIISDAALRALSLAGKVPTDALVVFVDDDDWLAPHLFSRLRDFASVEAADVDGFRWGSVLLGRDYKWTLDADANFALQPTVTLRPIDQSTIYTNNYAVSGTTLRRLGTDAVCEHFDAQAQVCARRFVPADVAQYLSCSNKHPASTVSAHFLLGSEEFRRDLRADIRRWAEGVMRVPLPIDLSWMAVPRQRLAALMADAARFR